MLLVSLPTPFTVGGGEGPGKLGGVAGEDIAGFVFCESGEQRGGGRMEELGCGAAHNKPLSLDVMIRFFDNKK